MGLHCSGREGWSGGWWHGKMGDGEYEQHAWGMVVMNSVHGFHAQEEDQRRGEDGCDEYGGAKRKWSALHGPRIRGWVDLVAWGGGSLME